MELCNMEHSSIFLLWTKNLRCFIFIKTSRRFLKIITMFLSNGQDLFSEWKPGGKRIYFKTDDLYAFL